MITSITDEDIKRINAYQRTLAAAVGIDKMRLLREQSTANIGLHAIVTQLDQEHRDRLARERQKEAALVPPAEAQSGIPGQTAGTISELVTPDT